MRYGVNILGIDTLARISLPTQNGSILLSEIVTISLRESSSVINHEEQKRIVSVTADVTSIAVADEPSATIACEDCASPNQVGI